MLLSAVHDIKYCLNMKPFLHYYTKQLRKQLTLSPVFTSTAHKYRTVVTFLTSFVYRKHLGSILEYFISLLYFVYIYECLAMFFLFKNYFILSKYVISPTYQYHTLYANIVHLSVNC